MSQSITHGQSSAPAAPTDQFVSTQDAPHDSTGISIEVPGPSPIEAVTHIGEANSIDPYFYQQNIHAATFTWNTKDPPGKLLWYVKLAPQEMNKGLAYLSKLYLTWVGDFLLTFKLAATSFHAGNFVVVSLPPTVHPESLAGKKDYTFYPWAAMDPKTYEIVSFVGRDKRPLAFHYVDGMDMGNDSLDIGGYIAAYVDLQLNTSATGSQAIQIQVWSKLAQNFRFSYIRPPTTSVVPAQILVPPVLDHYLHFGESFHFSLSSAPTYPENLVVLPAALKQLTTGGYNTSNLYGSMANSKFSLDEPVPAYESWEIKVLGDHTEPDVTVQILKPMWQWEPTNWFPVGQRSATRKAANVTIKKSDSKDLPLYTLTFDQAFSTLKDDDRLYTTNSVAGAGPCQWVDNGLAPPIDGESFLVFGAHDPKLYSIQTEALTGIFFTGMLKQWVPEGQCALFLLVDTVESLPLSFVKLYSEGFFTTAASTDEVLYEFKDMKLEFYGFINRTTPMPARSPEMSRNKLLIDQKHRALHKASRKRAATKHGRLSSISSRGSR